MCKFHLKLGRSAIKCTCTEITAQLNWHPYNALESVSTLILSFISMVVSRI